MWANMTGNFPKWNPSVFTAWKRTCKDWRQSHESFNRAVWVCDHPQLKPTQQQKRILRIQTVDMQEWLILQYLKSEIIKTFFSIFYEDRFFSFDIFWIQFPVLQVLSDPTYLRTYPNLYCFISLENKQALLYDNLFVNWPIKLPWRSEKRCSSH